MPRKINTTPATEYRREKARRRVGQHTDCTECGESRPEALISGSNPRICAECQRKQQGRSPFDLHHVAGQRNHPATVAIPANDHRAHLSPAQYNWPPRTLKNPDRSPLLVVAACIRGFIDFAEYCIEEFLRWAAELLEKLDDWLIEQYGRHWWKNFVVGKGNE